MIVHLGRDCFPQVNFCVNVELVYNIVKDVEYFHSVWLDHACTLTQCLYLRVYMLFSIL